MPIQSNPAGTGLSYTSAGGQYAGGVEYLQLLNNTTTSLWQGQLVTVVVDTSVQSTAGLGAVNLCAAATSAGVGYNGVMLANCTVTNSSSTATFQAQNKVGGPQTVDVGIVGGPVLIAVSTSSIVAPPAYLFPSTSAAGLAVSTGSIGATTVGGFGGPGSAIGVLLSTQIITTNSTGQALMLGMLGAR